MSVTRKITIQRSGHPAHEFELAPGVYSVGSDKDNKIVLPDRSVSWHHATLSSLPEGLFVEDLNSSNGTYVDGERGTGKTQVRTGQRIQVGYFVILVGDDGSGEAPAEAAALPPL